MTSYDLAHLAKYTFEKLFGNRFRGLALGYRQHGDNFHSKNNETLPCASSLNIMGVCQGCLLHTLQHPCVWRHQFIIRDLQADIITSCTNHTWMCCTLNVRSNFSTSLILCLHSSAYIHHVCILCVVLSHRGGDKMAAILQTIFKIHFFQW